VGWKLGLGEGERIGPGPVIGHLTSATQLQPDTVFHGGGAVALHADAEIALELDRDRAWPAEGLVATLLVGGEPRASGSPARDSADLVRSVAGLLDAMGERLEAGDRLIMGSIVQVAVAPGDEVVAELGALGRVRLTIGR
jgi:hypothetical protein